MTVYISLLPYQCSYVCFITASLIKAMQYGGNLESENPVFFESVSSAIDAIQIHRVRLTAGVDEVWRGFLDAHCTLIVWGNLVYPVNVLCRNLLSVSVFSATGPQPLGLQLSHFPCLHSLPLLLQ